MEREIDHVSINTTEELINAIVVRAVDDYRTSKRKLKEYEAKTELTERQVKNKNKYGRLLSDSQQFFISEWFFALTDVSGDKIFQVLESEDEN